MLASDNFRNAEKKSAGDFMESRSVQTDGTGSADLIAKLDQLARLLADWEKRHENQRENDRAAAEKQRENDQAAAEKRFRNLEEKYKGELAAAQQTRLSDLAPAAENERVSTPAKGGSDHISGGETKLSNFARCFMTPGTSGSGLMFSIFCSTREKLIKHDFTYFLLCRYLSFNRGCKGDFDGPGNSEKQVCLTQDVRAGRRPCVFW
jgi:hypothetical protein